ncbi:ATP-binding protein [Streptomyces albulus]|nr:ATP-binding protein [Streptomyces noursei]
MTGRQNELRRLGAALDDGAHGGTVRALVTGEPGIGRTTLLQACAAAARARGWITVEVRCPPHEHLPPFGLARHLAGRLAALLPPEHPAAPRSTPSRTRRPAAPDRPTRRRWRRTWCWATSGRPSPC